VVDDDAAMLRALEKVLRQAGCLVTRAQAGDEALEQAIAVRLAQGQASNLAIEGPAVAVGSATLNRGMMPMAAAALCYLEGLRPMNKAAVAFGSYGWGVGGAEAVHQSLKRLEWDILREPLRSRYRPTPEMLAECREVGRQLGQRAASCNNI